MATTNAPVSTASLNVAPHGSERLKKSTSARLLSRIGGVPLETTAGSDQKREASLTWPWRSASVQPLMTLTSAFEAGSRFGARVAVADGLGAGGVFACFFASPPQALTSERETGEQTRPPEHVGMIAAGPSPRGRSEVDPAAAPARSLARTTRNEGLRRNLRGYFSRAYARES